MPLGRIFLMVSILALIGLAVALVIGAAVIVLPVALAGLVLWLIQRHRRAVALSKWGGSS
jgi:hypothetical protein